MGASAGKTVLIVDDEPRTRDGIRKTLESGLTEVTVLTASSAIEAIQMMDENQVHLIITDIRMPEMTGLAMVKQMRENGRKPVVIVISGHAVFEYAQQALHLGVVQYLLKPLDKKELLEAVSKALELEKTRGRQQVMEKMVDKVLLDLNSGEAPVNEPVMKAMRYVQDHLSEPLGLKEVADYVHLNSSYFSFLFKEQAGVTFSEYVSRTRMQKAKELLLMTTLPIQDISERVGYLTSKYFIKLFREYTGVSPSQYRKQRSDSSPEI